MVEKDWNTFKNIFNCFLGNHKADICKALIEVLFKSHGTMRCKMSLMLHYLHFHLESFQADLGTLTENHGERSMYLEKQSHLMWI